MAVSSILQTIGCLVEAGLEAMRESGKIPRGPPDLPTGREELERDNGPLLPSHLPFRNC